MTDRIYYGHARDPEDTDLAQHAQDIANALAVAGGAATSAASALAARPSVLKGRTLAGLQATIDTADTLWAGAYGVDGGGTVDDTIAVQAALTAGETYDRVINFGAMTPKLTGPVTSGGPGIVFDRPAHGGDALGPGFKVTGSGYTALTVTTGAQVHHWCVTVFGTGNAVNGILFQNPILSTFQHTRVCNLAGFGVKINKGYDNLFGVVSVELCGTTAHYAFSLNDDGDTSNETHFLRLQVEECTAKVIFIEAESLNCQFDSIHSERNTANILYTTWHLGGNCGVYSAVRLHANNGGLAQCWLQGAQTTYIGLLTEGDIDVTLEGVNGASISLLEPNLRGTAHPLTSQFGVINLFGGYVESLGGDPGQVRAMGTHLATLDVGDAGSPPHAEWGRFVGCMIDTLTQHSAQSAATFIGCTIAEGGNLLRGTTKLIGTSVTCASPVAFTSGTLDMTGSTLTGSLVYSNAAALRLKGSSITGAVTCGDAGAANILADDASTVGAGSSGVGIPTGGTHVKGARHKNLVPAVASPVGWTCTAAGSPGTWTAEAVLA